MNDLYPAAENPDKNDNKESAQRKLRRLRIMLVVWIFSFLIAVIWFTLLLYT
ncbi:MAG TPA: hypothetical protein VK628_00655 [Flavitalea sp.]|nr:hypothetical protein [Flavitalea sp.]